jgi:hypothetical protein
MVTASRTPLLVALAAAVVLAAAAVLAPAIGAAASGSPTDLPRTGDVYATVRAPHCSLKGARTLAANRLVRVYVAQDTMRVFACRRSAARAYLVGDRGECQNSAEIDTAVVAGTFAANVRTCSLTHADAGIGLVNLRNGHVVFATNALTTAPLESETDAIRGMVVTPRGRVAWLALRRTGLHTLAIEVRRRAHGPDRHSALLDSGTGIDPRSLRRRGGRVVWTNAGATRSASM